MWQRFTEQVQRIAYSAKQATTELDERFVSTEHLLLGLLDVEGDLDLRVLERLNIAPDCVRAEVMLQASHACTVA